MKHAPALARILLVLAGLWAVQALALTVYAVSVSRTVMPVADVWDHVDFLGAAKAGDIDWAYLLQKHNGLHQIALPKLAYLLDVCWGNGQGLLLAGLACGLLVATARGADRLFQPLLPRALCLWAAGALCLVLQLESLVNPANLQWMMLNAMLVWTAVCFLQWRQSGRARALCASVALCVLAAGAGLQLSLVLLSLALVWCAKQGWQGRVLWATCGLVLVAAVWEWFNTVSLQWHPSGLVWLYSRLTPHIDAGVLQAQLTAQPQALYGYWLAHVSSFLARFLLLPWPVYVPWPPVLAVVIGLVVAVWWRAPGQLQQHPAWQAVYALWWTVLLTGLAAAVLRGATPDGYHYRFANLGLLFLVCTVALLWPGAGPGGRLLLALALLLHSAGLQVEALREAGRFTLGANHTRLSQVAYSLDVRDPMAVAEIPTPQFAQSYYDWIEQHKPSLLSVPWGVYASPGYRVWHGEAALPEKTVACSHDALQRHPVRGDARFVTLSGHTRWPDGGLATRVLVRTAAGQPVGYGVFQLPSASLLAQWRNAGDWKAYARVAADTPLEVIVWRNGERCQPVSF